MQQIRSPIKRSKQLAALSRRHHDILLFVWKIRQGITNGIVAQRIGNYCEWYWNNYLSQYFRDEEMALSKTLPACHALMNNLFEDHEAIRLQMEQVLDFPTYHSTERLAQIVFYHIRFEERILFPHIEDAATAEALAQAASHLPGSKQTNPNWNDEFWVKLK